MRQWIWTLVLRWRWWRNLSPADRYLENARVDVTQLRRKHQ